jgi:hypothetical protein
MPSRSSPATPVAALAAAILVAVALSVAPSPSWSQEWKDIKRVPPPGIPVPDADKAELTAGAEELGKAAAALEGKPGWPDVKIFHNALRYALAHNEFFDAKDFPNAKAAIKEGLARAKALSEGKSPWNEAAGAVIPRGYVSRIDGSVQPYVLSVPEGYKPGDGKKYRLDCWFHGRDEKLSELRMISQKGKGEFPLKDGFTVFLYGRCCVANKMAGEIDLFEAIADISKHYPIDADRIAVRGFSMGGGACWHFAAHFPGEWAAAAPGAGFSESPEFLRIWKNGPAPTWWEQKLYRWYDATDYAANLFNLPTVAYSGEKDGQKQAADAMIRHLKAEGLEIPHVIGPMTGHSYHKDSKPVINKFVDEAVAKGRDNRPAKIRFTTFTLRYNKCKWLTVDAIERHWERARVEAEVKGDTAEVKTAGVTALSLDLPAGVKAIAIDGKTLTLPQAAGAPNTQTVSLTKKADGWVLGHGADDGLRKRHGLQGPVDDAFMDSFVFVTPTGPAMNETVGKWAKAEGDHAVEHWRRTFRGEARVKADKDITDADIAAHNLVLWGDPKSNAVLAKIAGKLPIKWTDSGIEAGTEKFAADKHVPVLVYPNPLNPKRYVVINSGFTFREFDYLNNARQIAKLPDWAVIDVSVPATPRWPGKVVAANFFGERWELLPAVPVDTPAVAPMTEGK